MPLLASPRVPYQAHIDGLRGIAVTAVILFHLGSLLPGGFVGVDIFFVISGFIITLILQEEIQSGTFSLIQFFKRRILRIAPASLFLLIGVGALGYLFLFPTDLEELGQAILSQTLLVGNIFHMRETSYFDLSAEFRPLLHVWSLAIEEQYYLTYPFLLYFLLRRGKSTALIGLWSILIISFGFSLFSLETFPRAAFFLLPSRAWELLLGCAIALSKSNIRLSKIISEAIGIAGAIGILVAMLHYDSTTRFPGLNALLPCLGTAAILISNLHHTSLIGRGLSFKPLLYLGLLSYSLYLWHWPVISLARHLLFDPEMILVAASLGGLTIALASLSYYLIERPLRSHGSKYSWKKIAFGYATASTIALGIGGWFHLRSGLPERFSSEVLAILETPGIKHEPLLDIDAVSKGDGIPLWEASHETRPTVVIYGDSHAAMYFPLFELLGKRYDITVKGLYQRGAIPFFDAWSPLSKLGGKKSLPYKQAVISSLRSTPPEAIILVGRWGAYTGRNTSENLINDSQSDSIDVEEAKNVFLRQLDSTIQDLQSTGASILLVGRLAEPNFDVPRGLAHSKRFGEWLLAPSNRATSMPHPLDEFIDRAVSKLLPFVTLIDPNLALFDEKRVMRLESSEGATFFDEHHLSPNGAMQFEPLFAPHFEKLSGASKS